MARILLEPGEEIELCFVDNAKRETRKNSIVVRYFPQAVPSVVIDLADENGTCTKLMDVSVQ